MTPNKIGLILQGRVDELIAGADGILPGNLIERSEGRVANVSTETGKRAAIIVVTEDALQGKTVKDAYKKDSIVFCAYPLTGDVLQLTAPAGNYVEGTYVKIGANGSIAAATGTDYIIGEVEETVNLTAAGFVKVRII